MPSDLVEAHFGREVTSTVLDALDSREAWEVVVDAICDAIPEATDDAPHEEFAADAVLIEKLRAELHDEARERFESLSRALEARGFAIVRVR